MSSLGETFKKTASIFIKNEGVFLNLDAAVREARMIVSQATGMSQEHIIAFPEKHVDEKQAATLQSFIARRLSGEPMAYIQGKKEFYGREFLVDASVLIPRPETELLVEIALKSMRLHSLGHGNVLDCGTGCGCLAITLALEQQKLASSWSISCSDINEKCIELTKRNAERLLPQEIHISTFVCDLLDHPAFQTHSFDIIVANLPYICPSEYATTRNTNEPRSALVGAKDSIVFGNSRGIALLLRLIETAGAHPHSLILEIDPLQLDPLMKHATLHHYTTIAISQDLNKQARVLVLRKR